MQSLTYWFLIVRKLKKQLLKIFRLWLNLEFFYNRILISEDPNVKEKFEQHNIKRKDFTPVTDVSDVITTVENLTKDVEKLSYDFYLPEKNLLIELNGEQHYKPVRFSNISIEQAIKNLKKQRHHDWLKRKYAQKHNYKLLIIPYNEETQLQIKKGC